MDDEWITVGGNSEESDLFLFKEKGDTVEGVYTNMRTGIGENNSNMYTVKNKDGVVSFFGSTLLNDRMSQVPKGSTLRVEFLGMKKTKKGGRTYKDFLVQFKENKSKGDLPF